MKFLAVHPGPLMQTNFVQMLWKFHRVYNPTLQLADHHRPVVYEMSLPPPSHDGNAKQLFILPPKGRRGRALDDSTEHFIDTTRMGNSL
jgi:hopanoid C-3 methylase